MNKNRYILEPYTGKNSRHTCLKCGKVKTFSRYVDTQTGAYIHTSVGRCNREIECGYHYTPKQYFHENNISFDTPHLQPIRIVHQPVKEPSFIPFDTFKASLTQYETNSFVQYLVKLFCVEVTNKLIAKYYIGTSKHWPGSTVFWQIDISGKIHAGKIMDYDAETGHRIKGEHPKITWTHTAMKLPEFNLKQCLFGEHLLKNTSSPVAIVESEKTAIIASVYLQQLSWLACGGLSNLSVEKCQVLKGRTVVLFPDVKGWNKWNNKALDLSKICTVKVSDLLEKRASEVERMQGIDLADYLVKYDYQSFLQSDNIKTNVYDYWHAYPEAKTHFKTNQDDRPLFHREYSKLNPDIQCNYTDFEKYTFSMN